MTYIKSGNNTFDKSTYFYSSNNIGNKFKSALVIMDDFERLDFYDIVSSVITYGESSDVEFGSEFQIDYLGIFLELFGNTFRTRVRPKRRMK